MREIFIIKDGIRQRLPGIIKTLRNVLYFIIAAFIITAAILRRADSLEMSDMVTNIAVMAMVAYPLAVLASLLVKLVLSIFTSDEICVSDRRIFGYAMFGKPTELEISQISRAVPIQIVFKGVKLTDTEGKKYIFLGLSKSERICKLLDFLAVESKKSAPLSDSFGQKNSEASDTAHKLRKYQELLDKGIIIGEELEMVRKQIVGL